MASGLAFGLASGLDLSLSPAASLGQWRVLGGVVDAPWLGRRTLSEVLLADLGAALGGHRKEPGPWGDCGVPLSDNSGWQAVLRRHRLYVMNL